MVVYESILANDTTGITFYQCFDVAFTTGKGQTSTTSSASVLSLSLSFALFLLAVFAI